MNVKVIADQESIVSVTEEAKRRSNYSTPAYWLVPGGSHIGIKKGEELTLRDLLYGMMVASACDASNVIAQHVSGNIPNFMSELNVYLKEIGCQNTSFCNPHGLHHPDHQTTAYDMALMTKEALKNSKFCEIVGTVRYTRPKTNKQESTTLVQTNRLLRSGKLNYSHAFGVKTGHTSQALNTFVASAKKNDRVLIAVLLKSKERDEMFRDCIKMFEAAFNQPKVQRTLLKAGPQKFSLELEGAAKPIKTYISENALIEYYPAEEPKIKCLLSWDSLTLPIAKGQRVGELTIKDGKGSVMQKVSLSAEEPIQATWMQTIKHFFSHIKGFFIWKVIIVLTILCLIGWLILWLKR